MIGYANDPRNELKRSGGQLDLELFFLLFFFFCFSFFFLLQNHERNNYYCRKNKAGHVISMEGGMYVCYTYTLGRQ